MNGGGVRLRHTAEGTKKGRSAHGKPAQARGIVVGRDQEALSLPCAACSRTARSAASGLANL